jgi:hypothetical protein
VRSPDNNKVDRDKPVGRKRLLDHTTEHRRIAGWLAQL